jgi:hypothetical protein
MIPYRIDSSYTVMLSQYLRNVIRLSKRMYTKPQIMKHSYLNALDTVVHPNHFFFFKTDGNRCAKCNTPLADICSFECQSCDVCICESCFDDVLEHHEKNNTETTTCIICNN